MLLAGFLLCFLLGCHVSILPFPFFMESCNGDLLQLIECIESTQNEVKRKMIGSRAHIEAPKSLRLREREKIARAVRNLNVFALLRAIVSNPFAASTAWPAMEEAAAGENRRIWARNL
jgi:hypothetical protein